MAKSWPYFSFYCQANVMGFGRLIEYLKERLDPPQVTAASVLHSVQKVAVLISGWWVVKRMPKFYVILFGLLRYRYSQCKRCLIR
ncbi:unnamed protein product [Protopolystoma xenopodis]|uniref:Uncharacterized protein n=1 Tax=Protopolystoma xenopodis TaxID=117903 RepID=A0A448WSD4_9PLAT|nr:unnamed protein product [Protopolystoma xenopodis]